MFAASSLSFGYRVVVGLQTEAAWGTDGARVWRVDKPLLRVMAVASAVMGLASVILVAIALGRGASVGLHWLGVVPSLFMPVWSWLLWQTSRQHTSIGESEIESRSGRRVETVTWDRIIGMVRHHGSRTFSLRLIDGNAMALPGVPPSDFEEVSAIVDAHLRVPRQDWPANQSPRRGGTP